MNLIRPLLCILAACIASTSAIKIVVFLQGEFESDRQELMMISQWLANRNHKVATVKAMIIPEEKRLVKHRLHDVRELVISAGATTELIGNYTAVYKEAVWNSSYDTRQVRSVYHAGFVQSCKAMLDSDVIERIREGRYEVALTYASQPCHLAIAHLLAIPVISLDTFGLTDMTAVAADAGWQAGRIPSSDAEFGPEMSLFERTLNAWLWAREHITHSGIPALAALMNTRYAELDEKIENIMANDYEIKKRFATFPSMAQLRRRIAVHAVNWDRSLEYKGRPLPSNVIFVGGYHMEEARPLFQPWNESIASAQDGLILVSLGRQVPLSAASQSWKQALLDALAKMNRMRVFVLVDDMDTFNGMDLPANINITRHVPCYELLASGAVKVFVSGGGAHGLMEASLSGVPVLTIPTIAPLASNAYKLQQNGLGIVLPKDQVTRETMYKALHSLAYDPKYSLAARSFARLAAGRAMAGIDELAYALESLAQHGHKYTTSKYGLLQYSGLDLLLVCVLLPYLILRFLAFCLAPRPHGPFPAATELSSKQKRAEAAVTKQTVSTANDQSKKLKK